MKKNSYNLSVEDKLTMLREMRGFIARKTHTLEVSFCSAFKHTSFASNFNYITFDEVTTAMVTYLPELKPPQPKYSTLWWYSPYDRVTRLNILSALIFEYEDILRRQEPPLSTDFSKFKQIKLSDSNSNS